MLNKDDCFRVAKHIWAKRGDLHPDNSGSGFGVFTMFDEDRMLEHINVLQCGHCVTLLAEVKISTHPATNKFDITVDSMVKTVSTMSEFTTVVIGAMELADKYINTSRAY